MGFSPASGAAVASVDAAVARITAVEAFTTPLVASASVGNVTTTETDLASFSVPGGTLAVNGDTIRGRYAGVLVSSASATRQLRAAFAGAALFDSGALSVSVAGDWVLDVVLTRVSATVVRYAVSLTLTGASLGSYANVGELTGLTLSAANILKVTGQAAGVGAASNDLVAMLAAVRKA